MTSQPEWSGHSDRDKAKDAAITGLMRDIRRTPSSERTDEANGLIVKLEAHMGQGELW